MRAALRRKNLRSTVRKRNRRSLGYLCLVGYRNVMGRTDGNVRRVAAGKSVVGKSLLIVEFASAKDRREVTASQVFTVR